MLFLALEDISTQRQHLDSIDSRYLALKDIEKLFSTLNKTYYYLNEVQKCIHSESLVERSELE